MRALIDTNVVLDYVLERQPFHPDAAKIVLLVAAENIRGYLSSITPINVYYTGRKLKGRDHALKEVRRLVRLFEIVTADKPVLQNAFDLEFRDYEDAVQCASALVRAYSTRC
ncbi:MAG: PIN domain-containing protein [Acidobacteria bacterium]|nr:PIN domain-containing protein [Acidobacteriota bacterium]